MYCILYYDYKGCYISIVCWMLWKDVVIFINNCFVFIVEYIMLFYLVVCLEVFCLFLFYVVMVVFWFGF